MDFIYWPQLHITTDVNFLVVNHNSRGYDELIY